MILGGAMLTLEQALASVAAELGTPVPVPGADGGHVFELADAMRLGVEAMADGSGFAAWSVVAAGRPDETEAEERASAILRGHLGRLRRCGPVVASRGRSGEEIVYIRVRPQTEREWLDALTGLLNEAEAMRKALSPSGGRMPTDGMSLFSGMSGLLGRP